MSAEERETLSLGQPRAVLRATSRLTVLGARPNTRASIRNDWP